MIEPAGQTAGPQGLDSPSADDPSLPPGDSAVEIAARNGFGPLSKRSDDVWHGDSRPCVSCGQLVRRDALHCDGCGEDLSPLKIDRMRRFAGPWYVHEHVRPFPGVTFERLIRQIRRGVLTATTIVRGPTTFHQWRYAAETPGLSKWLGLCWQCQARVKADLTHCPKCNVDLGEMSDGATPSSPEPAPAPGQRLPDSPYFKALKQVVETMPREMNYEDEVPRVGRMRASWLAVVFVIALVGVLVGVAEVRTSTYSQDSDKNRTTETASSVGTRSDSSTAPDSAPPTSDAAQP